MIFLLDIETSSFARGPDKKPRDERSDKGKNRNTPVFTKKDRTLLTAGGLAGSALTLGGVALIGSKFGGKTAAKKLVSKRISNVVRNQARVVNQSGKDRFVGRLAKQGAIAFDKLGSPGVEGANKQLYDLYKSDLQDVPDELVGRLIRKTIKNKAQVSNAVSKTKPGQVTKRKPSFLRPTKDNSPILKYLVNRKQKKNSQR